MLLDVSGCRLRDSTQGCVRKPYRAWIDTYADEPFGEAVRTVIAISDRAAEATTIATRTQMLATFNRACQYEWLFWNGAYQRRGWPPKIDACGDDG